MGVVKAELSNSGLSGTLVGLTADEAAVELECAWEVETDSDLDTTYTVLLHFYNTPSLPSPGKPYVAGNDIDPIAFCDRLQAKPNGNSKRHWIVAAHYANIGADEKGSKNQRHNSRLDKDRATDKPEDWRSTWTSHWQSVDDYDKPLVYMGRGIDTPGQDLVAEGEEGPCINSALDPLLHRPPCKRWQKIFEFSRYALAYPKQFDEAIGTVNRGAVSFNKPGYGLAGDFPSTGLLRLATFGSSLVNINGKPALKITCTFVYDPAHHILWVLDAGYRGRAQSGLRNWNKSGSPQFDGSEVECTSAVYNIFDFPTADGRNGSPIATPRLLNGKGEPEPKIKANFIAYRDYEYSSLHQQIVDYFFA